MLKQFCFFSGVMILRSLCGNPLVPRRILEWAHIWAEVDRCTCVVKMLGWVQSTPGQNWIDALVSLEFYVDPHLDGSVSVMDFQTMEARAACVTAAFANHRKNQIHCGQTSGGLSRK